MKTRLFTSFAIGVLILTHLVLPVCSQVVSSPENTEDFLLTIRNVIQTADNIFEFDLWLQDTDSAQPMEIATLQFGILYHPDILAGCAATPQMVTVVPGSSQLPANMQPNNPNTSISGLIRVAGRAVPGTGNGFMVSTTAPGTRICRLRFTNPVPFPVNTQPCLEFTSSMVTNPLYATRVAIYINSTNTQLPVVPGENAQSLGNPVLNPDLNDPTPIVYSVTGGGGYCGSVSYLPVGLELSQVGVNYELIRDGISTNLIRPGTGWSISFGLQSPGTYTITGTNESGTNLMTGNAVIFELPFPVPEITISADQDTICQGSMVTFTALATNAENAAYQWYKNFVSVGNNSPDYSYTPNYHFEDLIYVKVTTDAGCFAFSDTLSSTAFDTIAPSVEIDSESTLFLVEGTELTMNALTCNAGENHFFQWYVNGLPVVDGNESHFTYFPENGDTVFVTMAVEDNYPCITTTIDQSDEVIINTCTEPPIAYDVWGSGEYCIDYPFYFGLTDTEPGVEYIVYEHLIGYKFDYIYDEFSGTGEPYTNSGSVGFVYWIQGINACDTTRMNGTVIARYFDDRAYISASANNICSGTPVTFTAHPFGADTITYLFNWIVNGITVYNSRQQFTYTPENGDMVSAIMSYPCPGQEFNNFILMLVRDAQGSTTTWTGNSGSDFQNPENWSNGVPQSDYIVNIPGGCLHYPILTTPVDCESIIIEDGGSFIGGEFLNEKSALIKCNISSPDFHFLSCPVSFYTPFDYDHYPTFGSVFPDNQQTVWARRYDEYSGDWVNLKFDGYLWNSMGFSIQSTQPRTAQFIGLLQEFPTYCGITQSNPGSDPDRVGWNLLGNPFPCSLDWDLIPNSTAEQAVYVWNGTQYISWNGTVGALTNGIIPPMNGFFVKALNPNQSWLIIPPSARVHGNVPFYKENIINLIELQVTGNKYSDVTFIHFNSEATEGFDAQFDARKLRGIEEAPQLFSYSGGKELSINEQPFEPGVVIELGFTCVESGNFILIAKGLESFKNNVRIVLEDQKQGILQDLSVNRQYSFSYISGENEHRFKLHFTEISATGDPALVSIYSHDRTIMVNNFTGLNGEIFIYDLTGRMLLNKNLGSGNLSSFNLNAATGPYLVKVITAVGVFSEKVVIM
jgi:hypothetical protein